MGADSDLAEKAPGLSGDAVMRTFSGCLLLLHPLPMLGLLSRCSLGSSQPFSAPATGLHRVSSRMRAHSGLSLQADEETSSFEVKNILLLASPFWLVSTPQAPSTLSILPREVRS